MPLADLASGVTTNAECCIALLAGLAQFLAQNTPQSPLEWFIGTSHMFPERGIDEGLVVAAPRLVNPALEPGHDVIVQSDCDARLPLLDRYHRPALGFGKVVLFPHRCSS
jgi:hypothetical protein